MKFSSVEMEGSLIPPETLDEIVLGSAAGQKPQDFGLSKKTDLDNEIAASWSDARGYWATFKAALPKLEKDKSSVSLTRDLWMLPLLRSLGFKDIAFSQKAAIVNSKTFAISHRSGDADLGLPIHIEGSTNEIDKRPPTGRPRISPHSLVQEYLNSSDHLWGIVSNGLKFRILRNSSRLSKPVYLEFNLEQLMESEQFSEFVLFYRLVHRSRWPEDVDSSHECFLEKYYQTGIETGGRIREHLREGVEKAILIFGNGFLSHPDNTSLRNILQDGSLTASDYYRQILRLIYRFLFLMVSEQRKLIGPDPSFDFHQKVYLNHYSLSRLRARAERQLSQTDSHRDIWESVKQTFRLLGDDEHARLLNMCPLNGDLFGPAAITTLTDCYLYNFHFMEAFQYLSFFRDQNSIRRPINYAFLDVEELGSVYESLLDHYPVVRTQGARMIFELTSGTERKTTGSYYTRPELVQELIKSALIPVMEERLEAAGDKEAKERAILSIKICDPAAGSGHFLLAAARTVGAELARIRLGEEQVTPGPYRLAVRDVIRSCIYGVDLNPLAVDLCKVALWIEGHHSGLPLTFLDHRIKCGNSLVGIDSLDRIAQGVPSEAFTPVHGDDKAVARNIKRINDRERNDRDSGQMPLELNKRFDKDLTRFAEHTAAINDFTDSDVEQVNFKETLYRESRSQTAWISDRLAANIWTGAFFYPLTDASDKFIPTEEVLKAAIDKSFELPTRLTAKLESLTEKHKFFHWPLEFPEVFAQGGFDVVLGNPPWERIKLQEQEFFAIRNPEIAHAQNKAARENLIKKLPESNPALMLEYEQTKHDAEATSIFFRHSGRLPLTARGDINTYALFAELSQTLLNTNGRSGIIVKTGIATDDTYKFFFENLNSEKALVSLYDFENREKLFPEVHSGEKFALLTMSRKPINKAHFSFFLTNTKHLDDKMRKFDLTARDLELINPNTRTAPIFRTKYDAEITTKIYQRVPVLINERTGVNPWGVKFSTMFHMSNDSHLFKASPGPGLAPLYEGKMVQAYDHRAASSVTVETNLKRPGQPFPSTLSQLRDPNFSVKPQYWISKEEVASRLPHPTPTWLIGFKSVTSTTNERTIIVCILPLCAVGNSMPLIMTPKPNESSNLLILANLNSLVFDYVVRQKVGGVNLNFFIIKQLPVLAMDLRSVVNSGHQLFKRPFVVRSTGAQRPWEKDSPVFSVFSDDYKKPQCIP
ncbi:MAG: Eco57I restriction-modification methylase domain-containing protein [Desulfomonilaceae bacterium]